jgi:hypothetical protein
MGNQYLKTVLVKYLEEVVRHAAMTWAGRKGSTGLVLKDSTLYG